MKVIDNYGVQIPNADALAELGVPFSGGAAVEEWISQNFKSPLPKPEARVARAELRAWAMWFDGVKDPVITDFDLRHIKELRDHFLAI